MLRSNYLNVRKLYEGFNLRRLLRVMLHRRHGRASPPTTSVPNPLHSIISVRRLVGLTGLEVEDDYDGMRQNTVFDFLSQNSNALANQAANTLKRYTKPKVDRLKVNEKKCPHCAEIIKREARICKHCHSPVE